MTLKSRVFAVRSIVGADAVGCGATFVAERRVGLVAMGHGYGHPRGAPTSTPVAIDGQP